eukprot:jgi/Chlat1/3981/Chrsp26S04042
MDLLRQYAGGQHEGEEQEQEREQEQEAATESREAAGVATTVAIQPLSAAPDVADVGTVEVWKQDGAAAAAIVDPHRRQIYYNPTYDQLWAPVAGPAHPYARDGLATGLLNHRTGQVEDAHINPALFDEQIHTFNTFGYAYDPSNTNVVGDVEKATDLRGDTIYTGYARKRKIPKEKEGEALDPSADDWVTKSKASPWAGKKEVKPIELTEEHKQQLEKLQEEMESRKEGKGHVEDKSIFHGKELKDYQGRSWLAAPKEHKADNAHCYIPKRHVHTWSGHTKGVHAIRFFPKTGHLLLSASMDTKVKIWDVYGNGKCMRTYMGHSKPVRDICFTNNGQQFLSASYDRNIKLWDTETGQVVSTFSTGKVPYVVKFNPDNDKQHIFLAGMSDKKIIQWDTRTGKLEQEYDQHLGAVNTITFVDDNRRFVTSSDDKSLRVWEFGIPVVIKYISEPHMHSMPALTLHPNGNWLAAQSLDNQILIYSTRERFRLNKKKRFVGHLCAGYACQVGFSPDGRFVISGDADGRCFFWDWKTSKIFRTLKCHDGVCIGAVWHPLETSKVATCGWDGLIKFWSGLRRILREWCSVLAFSQSLTGILSSCATSR